MNRVMTTTISSLTALALMTGIALAADNKQANQRTATNPIAAQLSHSLVVKIVAKAERAEDVAKFLTGALPLAQAESFTPVWFALRADKTTFYVFDAFANDADRTKHLEGKIAAALMANAKELLAQAPEIQPAQVMAAKIIDAK